MQPFYMLNYSKFFDFKQFMRDEWQTFTDERTAREREIENLKGLIAMR